MEIIKRENIKEKTYREILDIETHHNHEIIKDENGTLRWKEDKGICVLVDKIELNHLVPLLHYLGHDKNSEIYRMMYRDIGYSLTGYWEIFYWEINNEEVADYNPPPVLKITTSELEKVLNHPKKE